MNSNYMCRVCGAAFPEDELILMDDELICETCLEEETVVCSDCGTRIWNEQDADRRSLIFVSDASTAATPPANAVGRSCPTTTHSIWTTRTIIPTAKAATIS